ncbi:unnamed protein product [Linum trigynum]|uniref:RNase H type-1 domain-containing protein n=1 Tax=Linum trigynum TaxID=586398 RepID=A0AAV2ED20_9ROSI
MWDGAIRNGSHSTGGMVIKDRSGLVVLAIGVHFDYIDDPPMVEILVPHEVIQWCLDCGISQVCFEGDVNVVIDKTNQADKQIITLESFSRKFFVCWQIIMVFMYDL